MERFLRALIEFFSLLKFIDSHYFTMIKEIEGVFYVGGQNSLAVYAAVGNELKLVKSKTYLWPESIINGSTTGFKFHIKGKFNLTVYPLTLSYDNCLNWKQEHPNQSERDNAFDFQHREYHTPSGDWKSMNFTCMNSFIKSVELINNQTLWVCGTFGAFPRAFTVDKATLDFQKFVDINLMTCARYIDEPMATFKDSFSNLYVASGWGLYRPDKKNPDVPDNDSTMLYANWRLYRNLFTLPTAMAWVLSSDVNFINVVKETYEYLYFFGHEINNQYGMNNQDDRHAWQSFMIRICRTDPGFKYIPAEIASYLESRTRDKYRYGQNNFYMSTFVLSPTHAEMSHNSSWYNGMAHLPTKHFVSPLKINFGCYFGRRPRAISDNHYWGETNVVYFNQLVDVIFSPNRKIKFFSKNAQNDFKCRYESHSQIPLIGLFNRPGIKGTHAKPSGALCQLHINENIFQEIGSTKAPYQTFNSLDVINAHEEIMVLNSLSTSNFYSTTFHRTNGYTLSPYHNQGVLIGKKGKGLDYDNSFKHIGVCKSNSFYSTLNLKMFLTLQNFSNTAWPNELPNRLTSVPLAVCQYAAAELYSFNATFVLKDVEFKKLFLVKDNITNYHMYDISSEKAVQSRILWSPLMIFHIISTTGYLFRVVLCDFDNGMLNYGKDMTKNEWYNWCIFRHTDQPYLYRQYAPMERREWGESYQYRASSLLLEKKIITKEDESSHPNNRDPQFHKVKDVIQKDDYLHVLTSNNIYSVKMNVDCKSEYRNCVDCASDPDCMWHDKKQFCEIYQINYDKKNYLQDVLDRGFKCVTKIETVDEILNLIEMFFLTNSVTLSCKNAGYWRGKIKWKIDDKEIPQNSKKFQINNDGLYLNIIDNFDLIKQVSCYGIREDRDRLFNNKEYDWVTKDYSTVLLARYIHQGSYDSGALKLSNPLLWIFIVIIILLIALLAYLIFRFLQIKKEGPKDNAYSVTSDVKSKDAQGTETATTVSTTSVSDETVDEDMKNVLEQDKKAHLAQEIDEAAKKAAAAAAAREAKEEAIKRERERAKELERRAREEAQAFKKKTAMPKKTKKDPTIPDDKDVEAPYVSPEARRIEEMIKGSKK